MSQTKSEQIDYATTTIHNLSHDGRGIGTLENGKTLFVANALPGEIIKYKVLKKHGKYLDCATVEVLQASPDRMTPQCEHFNVCGGCSMQHLSPLKQIEFKQTTALDQLKHFGKVKPKAILPLVDGPAFQYRRKARLGVNYTAREEKLYLGFREKSSRFLADIQRCHVLHETVGFNIENLKTLVMSLTCFDKIPQIEAAISDDVTALIIRHMQDLTIEDLAKIKTFAIEHNFHIYLQPNSPKPFEKFYPENSRIELSYKLPTYALEFLFHPLDFTQVNADINQKMIAQAIELLDIQPDDTVLDLFCGLGNFTLPLATLAKEVVGIEGHDEMVNRATQNAAHNELTNVKFYKHNLDKPLDMTIPWVTKKYQKILLDPSRSGAKQMLQTISKLAPKAIVYVSCNPATLARDAGELVNKYGYKFEKFGLMNMFPQTSHVEAMALFLK